ncbi:MAG: threonine synthase [Pyrinomonadaceae bacterium]
MHYFSTNRISPVASFREALLSGQPDDKGLYFPSEIPSLEDGFLKSLATKSNADIAFDIMRPYVGDDIDDASLGEICSETVDFPFPLVSLSGGISALELFHGPTLAFKDVGARFMSRCLHYFSSGHREKTIVVVATSGDTGGAVAAGFHGVEGLEVVILYPEGRVSNIQELQLTTLGGNVTTLELQGSFDDCQTLAKQALSDADLKNRARVTSANSISIARWLPQQIYYFYAINELDGEQPVVSVPSGNFGNLAAGLIASAAGLPVRKFIAACNANDVVPRYLDTGIYKTRDSVSTLSNAMDVGSPSNFVRVLELFHHNFSDLNSKLAAAAVTDAQTAATMRDVYEKQGYMLDPHGAVGYRALADYMAQSGDVTGIFLETAHPVKFDSVGEILGVDVKIPAALERYLSRKKVSTKISNDYDDLKSILLSLL